MLSLITVPQAQEAIAANLRERRLAEGLTQRGLAVRSGVSLATLRKFEQRGKISLESMLRLAMALGCLDDLVRATERKAPEFASIDEVVRARKRKERKRSRGWRK